MKHNQRRFWWGLGRLVVLFAALCSVGCVKSLQFHQADPDFTRSQLQQGRLAVLPATSTTPMLTEPELRYLRNRFVGALGQRRPKLQVATNSSVDSVLQKRANAVGGQTSADPQHVLREVASELGVRYVAVMSFDRYSFDWDKEEQVIYTDPDDGGACAAGAVFAGLVGCLVVSGLIQAASGDSGEGRRAKEKKTRVDASAVLAGSITVFDTVTGKRVWVGATVTKKRAHRTTVKTLRGADQAAPTAEYPAPPSLSTVSGRFMRDMVDDWP